MADLDRMERALRNADAAGDVEAARTIAQAIRQAQVTPMPSASPATSGRPSIGEFLFPQVARDAVGGLVRGAGSIGATILAPRDAINSAMLGRPAMAVNNERRQDMTGGLQSMGADTDSGFFAGGKLLAEVAGTMGVGGALARGAAALPGVASRAAPALDALRTAGMSAGGVTGTRGVALRAAGGFGAGYAGAGLVNPEDAETGGMIGAAAPGLLKVAQIAGGAAGRSLRGAEQSPELAAAVGLARGAGYVIPPTQARPTLGNRIMEGFAGKLTTAQNASAKNQGVTNRLAAEALGLPTDAKITVDVLDGVREEAGKAYAALSALPRRPAVAADTLTNTPAMPGLDPKAAVFDLRKARNDATAWFRSYGRTADPDALAKAQAASSEAKRLEAALEDYASGLNKPELVQALREARQRIAKTYTVEGALNPASGSVDARKLAADLKKGKPLSGQLKDAASFGLQFPKAAQTIEGMGSLPQSSPLDWLPAGALSMATSNPLMMLGVAARPAARAATLSPMVQNSLVQGARGPAFNALQSPELQQFLLRSAPVAISSGGR